MHFVLTRCGLIAQHCPNFIIVRSGDVDANIADGSCLDHGVEGCLSMQSHTSEMPSLDRQRQSAVISMLTFSSIFLSMLRPGDALSATCIAW